MTKTAECLRAENSILTQQNKELQDVIRARREHKKGKQVVLEGQIVLTTKELTEAVVVLKNQSKKEVQRKRKRKPKSPIPDPSSEFNAEENVNEEPPAKKRLILSAVIV